jgi:hypothetical protein
MPDLSAAASRIFDAYNAKDFSKLRSLISPSIDMAHFNRNYATNSLDDLLSTMELFASQLMRDRHFEPPERVHKIGNTVIREGYWGGTPDVDIPGFGKAGEKLRARLCSVMRFDDREILVEWKDYG